MGTAFLACTILSLSAPGATDWEGRFGSYRLHVEWTAFGEDRVQMLVRTYHEQWRLPDAPIRSDNDRGYLIVGRLDAGGRLAGKPQVVGLLWHIEHAHDETSLTIGAPFTKDDKQTLSELPALRHLADGTVERLLPTKDPKVFARQWLEVGPQRAVWVDNGKYREVPVRIRSQQPGMMTEDGSAIAGRGIDGRFGFYQTESGDEIHDEWIENVFVALEAVGKGHIDYAHITNDLDGVIFLPFGGTFVSDGNSFDGATQGLSYRRPHKTAVVFDHAVTPKLVLSANQRNGLLYLTNRDLSITDMEGDALFRLNQNFLKMSQHPHAHQWKGTIWLMAQDTILSRDARWNAWQYTKGTPTQSRIDFTTLFKVKSEGLVPIDPIATAK